MTAAVAGAAAIVLGSPLPLLLAPLGAAYGALRFRAAGWRLEDGRLAVRSRRLAPLHGARAGRLPRVARPRPDRAPAARAAADVAVAFGKGTVARIRHLDADVARGLWVAIGPR